MPEADPLELLRLRTRRLNDRPVEAEGCDYVLCWLMQALRADENPTIDAALALANGCGLPVVVVQTLENEYPYASHRIHRFMLEASQSLEAGVEVRGLRFARYVRRPGEPTTRARVLELARRAAAVVVDDVPIFVTRRYADAFARRAPCAVLTTDACCLVPMNAIEGHQTATKAFRAAHTPQRELHLGTDLRQEPAHERFDGDLGFDETRIRDLDGGALDDVIAACGVDLSLPPSPLFSGRREAALDRLREAVYEIVPRYKWTRNNPAAPKSTARLSPWMHFGVLGPREAALRVKVAEAEGAVHPAARWKFLDELLTWREYHYHRSRHEPDFDRWGGLPGWARETLAAHADDDRPHHYDLGALLRGETHDAVWNAAQKQFLLDGWMHNNLRMYWVKQLLAWRPAPEEAWAAACYLNDRLSLDGRDPATYGGIRWGFGESKRASRETAIYGWVPRKTSAALRRREGVDAWVEEAAARPAIDLDVPADEAAALAPYL